LREKNTIFRVLPFCPLAFCFVAFGKALLFVAILFRTAQLCRAFCATFGKFCHKAHFNKPITLRFVSLTRNTLSGLSYVMIFITVY
jgi:hypothetical protein